MSRINVSLRPELIKDLNDMCEKSRKTVSSTVAEAITFYMKMDKMGLRLEDLEKAGYLLGFLRETDSVPIPSILLDGMIKNAMSFSEETTLKKWYDRGFVAGDLMKKYADNLKDLENVLKEYKEVIPASMLDIEFNGDSVTVTLSGAGYSLEASKCTVAGIDGFLMAFNFRSVSKELSEGFVKVIAEQIK